MKEKNKGITLIALIITIIILLILAGIAIASLTNMKILDQANKAKETHKESEIKEEINLAVQEIIIEELGDNSLTKIANKLPQKLDGLTSEIKNNKIIGEYKGYQYTIDEMINITVQKITGIMIDYSLSENNYTNKDIILTISAISTNGKIKNIEAPGNIEKKEENTYIITQNGNYEFTVKDIKDEEKKIIIEITNIDKEKPIIEKIEPEENTAKLEAKDVDSGIIGYAITNNSEEPSNFTSCEKTNNLNITIENLTSSTKYYIWVKDCAGNLNEVKEFETQAHRTYIYNYGDQCTDMTGGLIANIRRKDVSVAEFRSDCIYFDSNTSNMGEINILTNNKIDFSKYSKLKCNIKVETSYGYLPRLGTYSTKSDQYSEINYISNYATTNKIGEQTIVNDITKITVQEYMKMVQVAKGYIYQIWLE